MLQQRVDTHGAAGFDGFEQGDLDQDLLRGRIAQPHLRLGQHLHDACQPLRAGHLALLLQRGGFRLGNLQHLEVAAGNLEDQEVAEMVQQIAQQPAQVFAVVGKVI